MLRERKENSITESAEPEREIAKFLVNAFWGVEQGETKLIFVEGHTNLSELGTTQEKRSFAPLKKGLGLA